MGGGDAVQSKSVGSQLPAQQVAIINTGTRAEAALPRAKIKAACQDNPVVIDGEQTASEASNKNDEAERQTTRARTCSHIPVIFDWKDRDVESRCVALADPGEVETSDKVTSMHCSRDDLVRGERE